MQDELDKKLIAQVEHILSQGYIPIVDLAKKLGLDSKPQLAEFARIIVIKQSTETVLSKLLSISQQQQKRLKNNWDKWSDYFYNVEQLCGWLVLNSINPEWWYQSGQNTQADHNQTITSNIPLDTSAYIEVIISRGLLQRANYRIDDYGDLVADSIPTEMILYDASETASDLQILSTIYKDIRKGAKAAPQDISRLLAGIKTRARTLSKADNNKPIYYIVTADYLELIQQSHWFAQAQEQWQGKLQFICCDSQDASCAEQACAYEQIEVLDIIAAIISLNEE